MRVILPCFFINLRDVDLENISPSVSWNLRVFLNTLSADAKYRVQYCENFQLPIEMQVSEQRKTLSNFLFHFWNLDHILNILKKKMMVIVNVFPKLQTVKNLVTPLCKKRRFRTCSDSTHVIVSGILAKSPWECFYHVFSSILRNLIWNISTLVLGEI